MSCIKIYQLANLDYGRIDYAVVNGKIQTWEINDNPQLLSNPFKYERGRWPVHREFIKQFLKAVRAEESSVEGF